jgi:hypothetical protein
VLSPQNQRSRAYVRINGRQIWLGRYGSQESKDAYDAVVGQWISQGRPAPASETASVNKSMTIIELVDAYWDLAKAYYKAGPDRFEGYLASLRGALGILVRLFGETLVGQFGPLKLTVVRDEMAKPRFVKDPDPQDADLGDLQQSISSPTAGDRTMLAGGHSAQLGVGNPRFHGDGAAAPPGHRGDLPTQTQRGHRSTDRLDSQRLVPARGRDIRQEKHECLGRPWGEDGRQPRKLANRCALNASTITARAIENQRS